MKNQGIKKHLIYKKDKWNMLTVEENGKSLIVREISDQWGEECHTFLSRPELMNWVEKRFPKEDSAYSPDEWNELMETFRKI